MNGIIVKEKLQMEKTERIGKTNLNNANCLMKIVGYNNYNDIVIEFQDDFKAKIHKRYNDFQSGNVKNPYYKSVYGNGYVGEGKYKICINKEHTFQYAVWKSMLSRCYDMRFQGKHPTYKDCKVCEEWLNFQTFAEWFDKNFYTIDGERTALDKDILVKGNKIYSPETCVFVPQRINLLFVKCDKTRGNYPIGVCFDKTLNKYKATLTINNKTQYIGIYKTSEEAFQAYKQAKENYIKQVANEYKDKIPKKLYDVMYNYEVNVDD